MAATTFIGPYVIGRAVLPLGAALILMAKNKTKHVIYETENLTSFESNYLRPHLLTRSR